MNFWREGDTCNRIEKKDAIVFCVLFLIVRKIKRLYNLKTYNSSVAEYIINIKTTHFSSK